MNNKMKNPSINGAVIVQTEGRKSGTEVYHGPVRYSKPLKAYGGPYKNGFNPKKVVFFGEAITIYTKNQTIRINADGTSTILPVDTWIDEKGIVEAKVIKKYGIKQ